VANGNTPLLEQAPPGTEYKASSFAALKLSRPLLKACAELGYTVPTAVQVMRRFLLQILAGTTMCAYKVESSGRPHLCADVSLQAACVPLALLGRDICGSAHTGGHLLLGRDQAIHQNASLLCVQCPAPPEKGHLFL
jgi:hypothetical protein